MCQSSEISNLVGTYFKSNRMFETKCSKINRLQNVIEYKPNEQSTTFELKYGNRKLPNV